MNPTDRPQPDGIAAPLAIIGIGCLFPKADGLGAYWANIKNRVDCITDVPPTHWRPDDYLDPDPKAPDHVYAARGGFLDPVQFNPAAFGVAPSNLEATDTSQLLGLVATQMALEDAGYAVRPDAPGKPLDRRHVSVLLGVTGTLELVIPLGARLGHPIWRRALQEAGVAPDVAEDVVQRIADSYVGWQESSFPGLLGNVVAGRIANRFDLGGANCVVDAACASSLGALHLAAMELETRRADVVVTGGIDTFNDIFMYMCFSKTPALSPTGSARPFDAAGDGTILGEGLGVLVLKRLGDARAAGDRIYAVLRGVGASSDGRGNAVYAPKSAGQVEALRNAHRDAGVTPDTIELVEAHGTGTRVGDAVEATALTEVFRESGRDGTWCALGSVKSQIGHTKAAAGAAGLIKAALALHHKVLPPTIKVDRPLDVLQPGATPFYVNTEKRPWLSSAGHPRRAGVSAFGFGGSNFHCVLEEAGPEKTEADWDGDVQLLAFCADSPAALDPRLAAWPADLPWAELRERAAGARADWRADAPCRLVLPVQRGQTDLARMIAGTRARLGKNPDGRSWRSPDGACYGAGEPAGKLAVLFPGQGAQYPGMLRDLTCQFPEAHRALAEADHVTADGRRLCDLIYPLSAFTPEERAANEDALRATDAAQPALGAVNLGAWRVLESFGVRADAFAGHSYGELVALCAAGRISPADLHALSRERGRLMAEAPSAGEPGGMIAVHAGVDAIARALEEEKIDLVYANKNSPKQTVLSGPAADIERAAAAFAARQMRATRLAVAAAFHSPQVAGAEPAFRAALAKVEIEPGAAPVYANTTAAPYPEDADKARDLLAGQLARPVEWAAEIENLFRAGVRTFLEVGPGGRLAGLVGAILGGREHEALALDASNGQRPGVFDLACCLACLAVLGYGVDLKAWDGGGPPPRPPADGKPTLLVPICGANYVKPKERRPPIRGLTPPARPAEVAAPVVEQRPQPNGSPAPAMKNPLPPPAVRREPAAASAVDANALQQALRETRESLSALQKMQEQTAQLHRQFLEGQETAHRTVHLLVEQHQRYLSATLGVAPLPAAPPPAPVVAAPALPAPKPAPAAPPPPAPVVEAPRPAPIADNSRVEKVLLEVVSEKTGYPAEMLELDMALDADLGIDSIKRVEILSALQERLPDAPPAKPEHLGALHTLRQIAAFLSGTDADAPTPGADASDEPTPPAASSREAEKITAVLLEVVSEKTGYPAEMLELDMALDADLGIDSIKRVEILSALQERLPDAPPAKPEHLGTLHTLRQIAAFLANGEPAPASGGRQPPDSSPHHQGADAPRSPVLAALERSVVCAVPLDRRSEAVRLAAGAEIRVTSDDADLAGCVTERLKRKGYDVRLSPTAALRDLERPVTLGGLVVLAPAGQADDRLLRDALFGAQRVAAGLRRAGRKGGASFVTVSRMDGAFGLGDLDPRRDPVDGGLAGLAKTAGWEWPEVQCKAIDLGRDFADSDGAADALVEELLLAGPSEVGLSRSGRRTLDRVVRPLTDANGRAPFAPGDVIVATGGARGVTAEAAVALARAFRPTLVLLGRSPAPEPEPDWLAPLTAEAEIKQALGQHLNGDATPRAVGEYYRRLAAQRETRLTLERIAAAGGRAVYHSVDVRNRAAVADVLARVRSEYGPVRGLIHGAGVLADALIADKTEDQFDRVYGTKVEGLRNLLAAVAPEELRALVLFSSSTGRFGRRGQVDYAIANEVLNKSAQRHVRLLPSCRVVSFNWGPWDGGMVTPALKKLFDQEGVGLIGLEAGAEYLVQELRQSADPAVEVMALAAGTRAPARPVTTPDQPAAPARGLATAFERVLDPAEHPVLESHVLDGRPVLPLAMTLEWLAHAALHQNPGLAFHGCDDLRVLHGVVLDGPAPSTLRALAGKAVKKEGLYISPVELRGVRGDGRETLHARAGVVLAADLPPAPAARPAAARPEHAFTPEEIYRRVLFHGPNMRCIERVEACDGRGVVAQVRSAPAPAVWLRRPLRQNWIADPLIVDGGFQLMILWSFARSGAAGLPCHVARYRQYRRAFPADGARVVLEVVKATDLQAIGDLDFLAADGQVVARMDGAECTLDPALARAFRRNRSEIVMSEK